MLKGRSAEGGLAAAAGAVRPAKKLSFREPEIMGYAGGGARRGGGAGAGKDGAPPGKAVMDSGSSSSARSRMKNGRIARQSEMAGSCEDLDLESQAMRIVRTVGQAFEVCHKLSINSPQPDALDDDYEDREEEDDERRKIKREASREEEDGEEEDEEVTEGKESSGTGGGGSAGGGKEGGREEGEGAAGQVSTETSRSADGRAREDEEEEGVEERTRRGGREATPDVAEGEDCGEASPLDSLFLTPPDSSPHPPPPAPSGSSPSLRPSLTLDTAISSQHHSGNAVNTPGGNPGKRSPVGVGDAYGSQMASDSGARTPGSTALHHELQMLRERAEQQAQQTRAAVAQVRLLRDQLAAETAARIEAQTRTHQLLVHNRELLEHIEALVMHLQEVEAKQNSGSGSNQQQQQLLQHLHRPQNVTLVPQMPPLCDPQGSPYGYLPELQEAAESLRQQASLLSTHPLMDSRSGGGYAQPPPSLYSYPGYQDMESQQFQQQLQAQQQFQRQLIQKLQSLGLGSPYASSPCYQAGGGPFPNQPSPIPGYQSYRTSYSGSPVLRQRFAFPQSPEDQFPNRGSPGPGEGTTDGPFIRPLPQVGTLSTTDSEGRTRVVGPVPSEEGGTSPRGSSGGTSPRVSSSSGGVSPRQDAPRGSSLGPPPSAGKRRGAAALKGKEPERSATPAARMTGGASFGTGTLRRPANGPVITRSTSEKVPNRSELMSQVQRTAWARHTTK